MPTASEPLPVNPPRPVAPAFIIGVTGHMDIHEDPAVRAALEAQVASILDWVKASGSIHHPELGPGLGLKNTPIIVLSSLAPGADQLVATAAMRMRHRVMAPVPFALDQYKRASTFAKATEEEKEFLDRFTMNDDAFIVPLEEHADLNAQELRAAHEPILNGEVGKVTRRRAYQAAGELLAAYSHILLALTDDNAETVSGASATSILEVKRRGLTRGLLAGTGPLAWADTGPVFQLHTPRRPAADAPPLSPEERMAAGKLSVLQPYDLRPFELHPSSTAAQREQHALEWRRNGDHLLRKLADDLEALNSETGADETNGSEELTRMIHIPRAPSAWKRPSMVDGLRTVIARFLPRGLAEHVVPLQPSQAENVPLPLPTWTRTALERITRARRRVADLNRRYERQLRNALFAFMALAFLIVLLLGLQDNFEPRLLDHLPFIRHSFAVMAYGLVLILLFVAIILHMRIRHLRSTEKQDDYRALAEGLRVQAFWITAGIGRSAATHYMLRQRGELSWVRSALRSISFPFWPARHAFDAEPALRIATLEAVRTHWLREQFRYFTSNVRNMQRQQYLLHRCFLVATFTGVLISAVQLANGHMYQGHNIAAFAERTSPAIYALLSCTLVFLAARWLVREVKALRREHPSYRPPERHRNAWERSIHHLRTASGPAFLLATVIALSLISFCFDLQTCTDWSPPPMKTLSVLRNCVLTLGGFCSLWGALRFHTENLRRYDSMAALYRSADERLSCLLHPPDGSGADIAGAQELLFVLGKEALNENAEWLGMHRDRPIQPVLPV